jgi:hypothetical protein
VVHPTECPELGPICAVRDEPPQLHDQVFYVTELRPVLEYQLLEALGAELQLPLRLSATTVVYRRLDGTLFEPDYENIHHRNEVLTGVGDPWVTARLSHRVADLQLQVSGRAGLTLPLGRTEPDPFELGELGLPHQHVQFGTGTVTPLLGLELERAFGPLAVRAHGLAQLSLYDNRYGYRAGTRFTGGIEVGGVLGGALHAGATAEVFHEQPERWDGAIHQDGNLGRTDVLAGATLAYPLGGFVLSASVKVPVFQHVVQAGPEAGQLSYPAIATLGVQRAFDLTGR